ncbi:MAG: hypothetical protein IRY85_11465 [Micromonosporaceae bacterium]|nr:hypothetical protein [Micromonosporaceae bacterium]
MRTLLAALAAVLMVTLAPAAAAYAHDEVVPEVTLSINSIILDPIKGGTQTVHIGGDSSVPVRIYVEDFAYDTYEGTMQIRRGSNNCQVRAVCGGTGDVTITYPPVDPDRAYIQADGRVSPITVRAYADKFDSPASTLRRPQPR